MLNEIVITVSKMTTQYTGTVQMREESESGRIRKREEMWFKVEREGAAVTCMLIVSSVKSSVRFRFYFRFRYHNFDFNFILLICYAVIIKCVFWVSHFRQWVSRIVRIWNYILVLVFVNKNHTVCLYEQLSIQCDFCQRKLKLKYNPIYLLFY